MLTEALAICTGMGTGAALYAFGFRTGRKHRSTDGVAVCPCSHHIGDHENMTGKCCAKVKRVIRLGGVPHHEEWVRCTCQCYSGPELISSFTLRPVTQRGEANE